MTNIIESFNLWLRDKCHQTIYTLLLTHMDQLVGMLTKHINETKKWRSVVGPKTEEKLLANIVRSGPISVIPYIKGTFRVFIDEVYLVVNMNGLVLARHGKCLDCHVLMLGLLYVIQSKMFMNMWIHVFMSQLII